MSLSPPRQTQLSGYISACDYKSRRLSVHDHYVSISSPYRYKYEAKRTTSEAGIATSELKLPPRVAALLLPVCLAVLALPLEDAEVEEGTLRVELTTGEVVGIDAFAAPCWTSMYIPWKSIRKRKGED